MTKSYSFRPDDTVPPGATLRKALADRDMSQADLAARTGLTEKTISQIINGVAPISVDMADKLELMLGVPTAEVGVTPGIVVGRLPARRMPAFKRNERS